MYLFDFARTHRVRLQDIVARSIPLFALVCHLSGAASGQTLTGELRQWHKLTLSFEGPSTSEAATPNPFTHYRLNVTFTHTATGKTYLVPGYYAADGNAANTSATAGNIWRAHFAPDLVGDWTYSVSFRTGSNVATDLSPTAGASAGFFDAGTGSFQIETTNKNGRDFRGKGRLEYVGKHHLRFAGTGEYFMKAGTDSPENLLAYADFDGDFKADGEKDELIKQWLPHVNDWQEGDPVWQGTKGKGLIGAINYLASEGLNAFSFLTMNIAGDDKNVFPYTTYGERSRMDISRLDQWEIVFEHGTRNGMYLHFKTQETENERLLDNGNVGDQRALYYRELIARFSHHLALNWNLGEEINDASLDQRKAWAQYFYDHDPYRHHIVIHNGSSHTDLMGPVSKVTGMSRQMNEANFSDTFYQIARYVRLSAQQGKPWVVACDEPGNSSTSLRPDNDPGASHVDARKDALWATILAGGAGCEFYFGYNYPNSDLTCEDFRSRDAFWDYCRYSLEFFQQNPVSFELMTNHYELVSGAGTESQESDGTNGNRCLARIGHNYLVHLRSGGSHTLNLSGASGEFTVKWFNPRLGGAVIDGTPLTGGGVVALGSPPNSSTEDWIVLVQSLDGASGTNAPPMANAGPDKSAFLTSGSVDVVLNGSATDDGLPDEFSLTRVWSQVSGPAAVVFSSVSSASTTATFTVAGEYLLLLSASDTELQATDEVMVTISPASGDNLPPVFAGFSAATLVNQPLTLDFSEILAGATDPDGDPVSIAMNDASTSAGGEIVMGTTNLVYTPAIDYFGTDSFQLTVEDGRGGSTNAELGISVVETSGIQGESPRLEYVSGENVGIQFTGVPGLKYTIQRSINLDGWSNWGQRRADEAGLLEILDEDPPEGRAFYRIAYP